MIKNIVFDIGNVLAEFCWEEFYRSFGFSEEVFQKVAKATAMNEDWNELDRGVMPVEAVVDLFVENDPSVEAEIRMALRDFSGILKRLDYAIPWIEDLKGRGYRVYYLSNFFDKVRRECMDTLDFMSHMDGGIMSYTVQLIKPDYLIYEELLKRYDLNPQECVFIDDREVNCQSARELGMTAIQFQNVSQAKEALNQLLSEQAG